jgi:hypothetical protein
VNASFAGDSTFAASGTTSGALAVAKANPSCSVTPYSVTYDGSPHTATGSCTGVGGASLSGLDLSGTTHTNADDYTGDSWSFPATTNYNSAGATIEDKIAKAGSTTTVSCGSSYVYNATPQGCTASWKSTGADNEGASLTVNYSGRTPTVYSSTSAPTNAGDYTGQASFGGDTNHTSSGDSKDFSIAKANPSCSVTPYSVTYDGSPHTATGSCTGVGGVLDPLVGLNLSGTTHTNPGTYTDLWSFNDLNGNYEVASGQVTDRINYNLGTGFLPPLDPNDLGAVWNVGNAGKTYPIKWQLTDANGNYVTNAVSGTTIAVAHVTCPNSSVATTDPLDYTSATGGTALRYDSTANQYIYNWQTPSNKGWCYKMTVTLPSGQTMIAAFQMK